VFSVERVRYVLYETKGNITIVPEHDDRQAEPPLVQAGLDDAVGYP
jgi:hypothetical protein